MVMQVKEATFQGMGSGGKSRTENRWAVSDAGQSVLPEVYRIFSLSTSRSRRLTDRAVPDDTSAVSEISI